MKTASRPETEEAVGLIEQATAEIRNLAQKEVELLGRKQLRHRELCEADQAAGLELLAGRSVDPDQAIRIRAELGAIEAALKACRAQRLNAIRGKIKLEAKQKRERIAELEVKLLNLESETLPHLVALSALEQVSYTRAILSSQPLGNRDHFAPRSEKLAHEIAELQRATERLEAWELPRSGRADVSHVTQLDEFLTSVLMHESESPTAEDVLNWANATQASALKRRANAEFGNKERRYVLVWQNGSIDFQASYIYVSALAHVTHLVAGDRYDIDSATFRAEGKEGQASESFG